MFVGSLSPMTYDERRRRRSYSPNHASTLLAPPIKYVASVCMVLDMVLDITSVATSRYEVQNQLRSMNFLQLLITIVYKSQRREAEERGGGRRGEDGDITHPPRQCSIWRALA